MRPLFLGNHSAIDFLNTTLAPEGEAIETLADGKAYLDWLVDAGLMNEDDATKLTRRFGAKALDRAANDARRIREWAREWLTRWRAHPKGDYQREIAALNKLLHRVTYTRQLEPTRDQMKIVDVACFENAEAIVGAIAMQLASLISQESPSLIRECAGPSCTLWFLDETKSHRRLFCSASKCGNRAKVAAFRERQRA